MQMPLDHDAILFAAFFFFSWSWIRVFQTAEETIRQDHRQHLCSWYKHSIIYFEISPWLHWFNIYSDFDFRVNDQALYVAILGNNMLSPCPDLTVA